jgi:hypothetical protein
MRKLRTAIVAVVVGLGLSVAVVGCSNSSGNPGDKMKADKMGSTMSGDNKMTADKMEGSGKMSPGKMGDTMSGENKMSGDSKMAADKMSGQE